MKIRDILTADGVSLADLDIQQRLYTVDNRYPAQRPLVVEHSAWTIRVDSAGAGSTLFSIGSNYERPDNVYAHETHAYTALATLFEAMTQEAREAAMQAATRKETNP